MDEMSKIRLDKLQRLVDKAERLEKLMDNPEYQEVIEMIKKKQDQFYRMLSKPKPIGSLEEVKKLNGETEFVKYTAEDDSARIKEAQYRYDTFQKVLNIVPDFIKDAERCKPEIEKLLKS